MAFILPTTTLYSPIKQKSAYAPIYPVCKGDTGTVNCCISLVWARVVLVERDIRTGISWLGCGVDGFGHATLVMGQILKFQKRSSYNEYTWILQTRIRW